MQRLWIQKMKNKAKAKPPAKKKAAESKKKKKEFPPFEPLGEDSDDD